MSSLPREEWNGILCIDKPQAFTSFDVIAKLRGMLHIRRLGHAGTLDPMATGVLPVLVGRATRACDILPDQDKAYMASFQLGLVSDTQDIWGSVSGRAGVPRISRPQLEQALGAFRGQIQQIPPMFSAVQVGGQRLYDLARQGMEVERQPRTVEVRELELLSFSQEEQSGVLEISCSKGTYIRTIIHDIGAALGCGAVVTALRRTRAAGFGIGECLTLRQIQQLSGQAGEELLLPLGRAFDGLPAVWLDGFRTRLFLNGVPLDLRRVRCPDVEGDVRVMGADRSFLGVARPDRQRGTLQTVKILAARQPATSPMKG